MDTQAKSEVLVDFTKWSINKIQYLDFFRYNDLGIPTALAIVADLVTINPKGTEIINETYRLMCLELGVDENKPFETFEDILEEIGEIE